jgi:transcriptional regulator with XRE-family HTH domain
VNTDVGIVELEEFGRRIRDQRRRLGLSVRALASKAGISSAYVTSIEVGRNPTTGRPPTPSIHVVRRLADALELDVAQLLDQIGASTTGADHDHVLLYCLGQSDGGMFALVDRLFGSWVDHWLYIADPREAEVLDQDGRAAVAQWELGAFPYETHHLDPGAVVTALDVAVRSLSPTLDGRRVGFASADSSAVMRWLQDPASEVALERTWHTYVNDACIRYLGTEAAIDVCVYDHEDIQALGLTIDPIATALALIQSHDRVFVWDHGETVSGPLAIRRILGYARPAGVSVDAWTTLTDAAAESLAGHYAASHSR